MGVPCLYKRLAPGSLEDTLTTPLILKQWARATRWPGGAAVFSWVVGRAARYTGTIGARVMRLEPGRAEVRMRDRRGVRNHLRSVHAVATINLGELAGSLALMTAQPPGTRWIVTGLAARYLKKARGSLVATCEAPEIDWTQDGEHEGLVAVRDAAGDLVTEVRLSWRVGPIREPKS